MFGVFPPRGLPRTGLSEWAGLRLIAETFAQQIAQTLACYEVCIRAGLDEDLSRQLSTNPGSAPLLARVQAQLAVQHVGSGAPGGAEASTPGSIPSQWPTIPPEQLFGTRLVQSDPFSKSLARSYDPSSWKGWSVEVHLARSAVVLILLRRVYLPPGADTLQDIFVCVSGDLSKGRGGLAAPGAPETEVGTGSAAATAMGAASSGPAGSALFMLACKLAQYVAPHTPSATFDTMRIVSRLNALLASPDACDWFRDQLGLASRWEPSAALFCLSILARICPSGSGSSAGGAGGAGGAIGALLAPLPDQPYQHLRVPIAITPGELERLRPPADPFEVVHDICLDFDREILSGVVQHYLKASGTQHRLPPILEKRVQRFRSGQTRVPADLALLLSTLGVTGEPLIKQLAYSINWRLKVVQYVVWALNGGLVSSDFNLSMICRFLLAYRRTGAQSGSGSGRVLTLLHRVLDLALYLRPQFSDYSPRGMTLRDRAANPETYTGPIAFNTSVMVILLKTGYLRALLEGRVDLSVVVPAMGETEERFLSLWFPSASEAARAMAEGDEAAKLPDASQLGRDQALLEMANWNLEPLAVPLWMDPAFEASSALEGTRGWGGQGGGLGGAAEGSSSSESEEDAEQLAELGPTAPGSDSELVTARSDPGLRLCAAFLHRILQHGLGEVLGSLDPPAPAISRAVVAPWRARHRLLAQLLTAPPPPTIGALGYSPKLLRVLCSCISSTMAEQTSSIGKSRAQVYAERLGELGTAGVLVYLLRVPDPATALAAADALKQLLTRAPPARVQVSTAQLCALFWQYTRGCSLELFETLVCILRLSLVNEQRARVLVSTGILVIARDVLAAPFTGLLAQAPALLSAFLRLLWTATQYIPAADAIEDLGIVPLAARIIMFATQPTPISLSAGFLSSVAIRPSGRELVASIPPFARHLARLLTELRDIQALRNTLVLAVNLCFSDRFVTQLKGIRLGSSLTPSNPILRHPVLGPIANQLLEFF